MKNTLEKIPFTWLNFEIDNFDDFEELVQDWSIDFNQLDGGSFYSNLQQMILPEMHIGQTHFDCHIDQKGISPDNMWSFVILGENSSMFKFNHLETKSTSTMLVYSPGQKINAVSISGFHVYILSIEDSHLKRIAISLGLEKIEEKLDQIDRVELSKAQAVSLREELQNILSSISLIDEKVISSQEKELFLKLLPTKFLKEIHIHAGCAQKKVFKKKHLLYMQARAYMHTHLQEDINIERISKKFKLSPRTLRNYFQEELGISPKQYLSAIRLNKVKDVLAKKDNNYVNIEQTARRFGFNHLGQFSASYKDFFGELPSDTILS